MVSVSEFYFQKIYKYLIGSYLNGVPELINLSRTSTVMRAVFYRKKLFTFILNRNLESLLLPFGIQLRVLQALLESTGAVISGSIVLQAYIGANWEGSDLDIYVRDYRKRKHGKKQLNKYRSSFSNFVLDKKKNCTARKLYNNSEVFNHIGEINELHNSENGRTVQIISVSVWSLRKVRNVVRTFDLSIVANYYTGSTWKFLFFHHILNRRMLFLPRLPYTRPLGRSNFVRILKYMNRGFRFVKRDKPISIHDGLWNVLDEAFD